MKRILKTITLTLIIACAHTAFGGWAQLSPLFKRSAIGAVVATSLGTVAAAKVLRPAPAAPQTLHKPTPNNNNVKITAQIAGTIDLYNAPLHDVRRNSLEFLKEYGNEYATCTQLSAQNKLQENPDNAETCNRVKNLAAVMMTHADTRYTNPFDPFFNSKLFAGKNLSINKIKLSNIGNRHSRYMFAMHNARLNDEDNKTLPQPLLPDPVDLKLFPTKANFEISASFTDKNTTNRIFRALPQWAQEYGTCMKLKPQELSNNETCKKIGAYPLPNVTFTQFDVTVTPEQK